MKGNVFIKRPVMAMSIAILIVIVGIISLMSLPVEQYPDIAPPTVVVDATYTGASADAVMNSVIMPLEESINGVENMMYITSTATNSGCNKLRYSYHSDLFQAGNGPGHGRRQCAKPCVKSPGTFAVRGNQNRCEHL